MRKWLLGVASTFCAMMTAAGGEPTLIPYSSAMTATGSSYHTTYDRNFGRAIDGSGLSTKDDGTVVHTSNCDKSMWMTNGHNPTKDSPVYYCVDLGREYWLASIKIWNFNMSGQTPRGVKATEIYISPNVTAAPRSAADIRAWGEAVWTGELPKAENGDDYAGCDPINITPTRARYVGFVFTSYYGTDNYCGLSEVRFFEQPPEGAPDLVAISVAHTENADSFTVSATVGAEGGVVKALAYSSTDAEPVVTPMGEMAADASGSVVLSDLAANTTYSIAVAAEKEVLAVTNALKEIIYTGTPILTSIGEGQEAGCVPAKVRVSRASASPYPLVVNYKVSSENGADGKDYVAPSGVVTIPAGADSADIEIAPLVNALKNEDVRVVVSLDSGLYFLTDAATAEVSIVNAVFPTDRNVWIALEDSDGLASTAENWSLGVPNAAEASSRTIVLDGTYSNKSMTWDLPAVNSLVSYLQTENYAGEVIVPTCYPDAGDGFEALTVEGDMEILGGAVKQQVHEKTQASGVYRLKLNVNGKLTIGADGRIDVSGRGLYSNKGNAAGHGGDVGAFSSSAFTFVRYDPSAAHPAHGSILLPTEVGFGANSGTDNESKRCFGGGALDLTVAGILTNDGRILAEGGNEYAASGSGGSILIHAKSLAGSGTYSVNARKANKSDGTGAMGAGGRIAVYVAEGTLDRAKFSALSYREGWGKMGGHGTIYLDSPEDKRICVVGQGTGKSRISGWNWATTPIPAADDPADWVRDFRKVTLIASTSANLRLTRSIRMRAVEVRYEEKDANARVGARVDLAGNTLTVQKVIVDGVDLKLPPGVYTAAEVKDRANMGWLVDSSQQKFDFTETYNGAERNVRDLTKYGYGETPAPGELRVVGTGLTIRIR